MAVKVLLSATGHVILGGLYKYLLLRRIATRLLPSASTVAGGGSQLVKKKLRQNKRKQNGKYPYPGLVCLHTSFHTKDNPTLKVADFKELKPSFLKSLGHKEFCLNWVVVVFIDLNHRAWQY